MVAAAMVVVVALVAVVAVALMMAAAAVSAAVVVVAMVAMMTMAVTKVDVMVANCIGVLVITQLADHSDPATVQPEVRH